MNAGPKLLRRSILAFAIVAPFITAGLLRWNVPAALLPLFVSHVALLWPTLNPHAQWWGFVARSFVPDGREVWLTIDDGPSTNTSAVLELLRRHRAKATFFVIGSHAEARPHDVAAIAAAGHQISNHTATHPSAWFWCGTPAAVRRQIVGCNNATRSASLFRAPAGLKGPFVHRVLRDFQMTCVGWSVRAFDTVLRRPQQVANRVACRARPGAIILLHECSRRGDTRHVECLDAVLAALQSRGFRFVIPDVARLRASLPDQETAIPINERRAEEHPDESGEREIRTEGQLG